MQSLCIVLDHHRILLKRAILTTNAFKHLHHIAIAVHTGEPSLHSCSWAVNELFELRQTISLQCAIVHMHARMSPHSHKQLCECRVI